MGIIVTLISIAILIICNKILKYKIINPISFFYCLWSAILFLSTLNLYGLKKPSNEAYFLILLMIIYFFIGILLFVFMNKSRNMNRKLIKEKKETFSSKVRSTNYKINTIQKKVIYVLYGIIIFVAFFDICIVIKNLMLDVPMWQIRNWTLEPFGSNNPIIGRRTFVEELFRNIIIIPFELISPAIAAYTLFNKKGKEKDGIILSVLSLVHLLLICISSGGGRLNIIYFVGTYILAFLYSNKINEKDLKKYLKGFAGIIAIGMFFVILLSALRNGSGGFIRETYRYFAMSPTLLSEWLPEIVNINNTYGMLTLFGIHSYLFRGLSTIGLESLVPQVYNEAYQAILNAEIFKDIGAGIGNAFVTPVYYFIIDGGPIFLCLASMIFGFIINYVYNDIQNSKNIKNFVIYALIMYAIFISFMRIQTCIPSFVITIILTLIILDNKIYERKKK